MRTGWVSVGVSVLALFGGVACLTTEDSGFGEETPDDNDGSSSSPTPTTTPTPARTDLSPLSMAEVILNGELPGDAAGASAAIVGDLNGDGYDDVAIGAPANDDRQEDAGKIYVLFGSIGGIDGGALADAPASFQGEGRDDGAGESVSGAGDLNGDGYDDLLIGAPRNDYGGPDAGRLYVVLGRTAGWYPGTRLANADFSFYGEEGDRIGDVGTVGGGGDLNGDGYADLAIGAPFNSDAATEAGKVYVVTGRASGWEKEVALRGSGLELLGAHADDWAGFSVAIVSDVNGDKYDDLVIGAPHSSTGGTGAGQIYVFLGKASLATLQADISLCEKEFVGYLEGEEAGASVAGAGDVDGDGLEDLVIGAWGSTVRGDNGRFYLELGSAAFADADTASAEALSGAAAQIWGGGYYDYVGRPAMGVGDLDGDGLDEVVFGSSLSDQVAGLNTPLNAGAGLLFMGRASGWSQVDSLNQADFSFYGEAIDDNAGYAVGGRGDVDGDGYSDFLIGAMGHDRDSSTDVGRIYLYYGGSPFAPPYLGAEGANRAEP